MSNASDHPGGSEGNRSADAQQGSRLARNLWMLKGFLVALALVVFGVAILYWFDGALANVVWAMSITIAVLIVLVQLGIALVQSARSV